MEAAAPIRKVITAIYDFNDNGGAVSTIALNTFIPPRSMINYGVTLVETLVAANVGCTISIGVTGTPAQFLAATAFAAFTAGAVLNGVPFATGSTYVAGGAEITTTIAVATVTAGRFFVTAEVLQFPSPI